MLGSHGRLPFILHIVGLNMWEFIYLFGIIINLKHRQHRQKCTDTIDHNSLRLMIE